MRGTGRYFWDFPSASRITPADAGNRLHKGVIWKQRRDHPRGCGEQCLKYAQFMQNARITPADAGNSVRSFLACANAQDHPRGCGEQLCAKHAPKRFQGSPPRMRGTAAQWRNATVNWRITPADAGNSISAQWRNATVKDHPRGCGEQSAGFKTPFLRQGSPPRMRGTVSSDSIIGL